MLKGALLRHRFGNHVGVTEHFCEGSLLVNAAAKEIFPETESNSPGTHTPLEVWLRNFCAPSVALPLPPPPLLL